MNSQLEVLSVVEQGSEHALREVIRKGGRVDVSDEEGSSSLLYAAAHGREDIVRILLENKVDVNGCNLYGWTALMQAACYGHLASVQLLLQNRAKVNVANSWGATALVGAAQGGFLTVVQLLLAEGAEVNTKEEVDSLTPLMAASQCGHDAVVTQLISTGSFVNAHLKATGWTAIMLAVLNNQLSTVKLLLQHGADREARDVNGRRAVELTAILGHEDIGRLLTGEKRQDKDKLSSNEFFDVVKAGEVGRVREMLARMPSLAHIVDKDGATPLMFAANKGHVEICKALLGAGADVNAKDSVHGWTPLMLATHQRRSAVAKLLGQHGADVNHRGKSGSTAFDIANMIGDVEMIQTIASISVERIQRQGAPPPATPTTDDTDVGEKQDKPQVPSQKEVGVASRFPKEERGGRGPGPVDPAELIERLKRAYRTPENVPIPVLVSDDDKSSPASGFPMNRVRSNSRISSSTPASLNASSEKTADSTSSTSSTSSSRVSQPHAKPSQPLFHIGGSPRGNGGLLAPTRRGTNQQGSILEKYLSKSNSGGGGAPQSKPGQQYLRNNPLVSPQNSSRALRPKSVPSARFGGMVGRDEVPSFLHKLGTPPLRPGSRPQNHTPIHQMSFPEVKPRKSPRLRNRSYTDPFPPPPPHLLTKSSLKQLGPPPSLDMRAALQEASLGHIYPALQEQEVDYCSFLTLTDGDMQELGIRSKDDRRKLLSLISNLNAKSESPRGRTFSGTKAATPVFEFQ